MHEFLVKKILIMRYGTMSIHLCINFICEKLSHTISSKVFPTFMHNFHSSHIFLNAQIQVFKSAIDCMTVLSGEIENLKSSNWFLHLCNDCNMDLAEKLERYKGDNRLHHSSNQLHLENIWKNWNIVIPNHWSTSRISMLLFI